MRRIFIHQFAATLGLACVCSSAGAEPLLVYNRRVFIKARIDGVDTEVLLDSAAESTVADPRLAERAHLPSGEPIDLKGSGGSSSARIVQGVRIDVLGLTLHPDAIAVTDLSDISQRLVRRPVQLIIGRELFDAARLQIDLRRADIRAVDSTVAPPGMMLSLRTHAGNESLPVRVNGMRGEAEFDLGNGSDVLISRAFAQKLHLKAAGSSVGGGIGGALSRQIVWLRKIEIAGVTFLDVRAAIDDQPSAGDVNIGTRILRRFLITADFQRRAIWLKAY